MTGRILQIHTYPTKGAPGTDLTEVVIEPAGLVGDRRKKAAVHVVARADAAGQRANLVVDLAADDLRAAVGRRLQVGAAVLVVTGGAGSCPGVYAEVEEGGRVRVADDVRVGDPTA